MKRILLIIGAIIVPLCAAAQVAVVPLGGTMAGNGGEMTVSLGQCATQSVYDTALTVSARTASLTEGVIQPYLIVELASIDDVEPLSCNIKLYPNPTTQNLTIEADDYTTRLNYTLYSSTGMTIMKGRFEKQTVLDVSDLLSGQYILRVEDTNRKQSNVYKVVKIR
ncbi:MAG: T9SS type A sorting domain-containing protein [Bacteroidales bacterium]|nr:T9SS type A sorting domain-containing protein [Bacteroidales bacterium]